MSEIYLMDYRTIAFEKYRYSDGTSSGRPSFHVLYTNALNFDIVNALLNDHKEWTLERNHWGYGWFKTDVGQRKHSILKFLIMNYDAHNIPYRHRKKWHNERADVEKMMDDIELYMIADSISTVLEEKKVPDRKIGTSYVIVYNISSMDPKFKIVTIEDGQDEEELVNIAGWFNDGVIIPIDSLKKLISDNPIHFLEDRK